MESVFGLLGGEASVVPLSTDVHTLTGRPPRTFEQWVTEHVEAFH